MPSTAVNVCPKSAANAYSSQRCRTLPGAASMKRDGASAKSISSSGCVVLVGDGQHVVEDGDSLVELVARDRQRRANHEHVPVRHQVDAALECRLADAGHRRVVLAAAVERHEHLPRLAVAYELQAPEAAEPAHLADRRVLLGK